MSDSATPTSGREADGRFAKGNLGGPGNPFARKTAALRQALIDAVTPQDIREIACILLLHAKAGELASIKLLFQYVIGKPQPAVDPDTLDTQEMRAHLAAAFPEQALEQMMQSLPLEHTLDLWSVMDAVRNETAARSAEKSLANMEEKDRRREEHARKKVERKQRREEARRRVQERRRQPATPSVNGVNGERTPSPNGASKA